LTQPERGRVPTGVLFTRGVIERSGNRPRLYIADDYLPRTAGSWNNVTRLLTRYSVLAPGGRLSACCGFATAPSLSYRSALSLRQRVISTYPSACLCCVQTDPRGPTPAGITHSTFGLYCIRTQVSAVTADGETGGAGNVMFGIVGILQERKKKKKNRTRLRAVTAVTRARVCVLCYKLQSEGPSSRLTVETGPLPVRNLLSCFC